MSYCQKAKDIYSKTQRLQKGMKGLAGITANLGVEHKIEMDKLVDHVDKCSKCTKEYNKSTNNN